MKSILKSVFLSVCVLALARVMPAQTFSHFNPPPCDFNDLFYAQNGLDSFEGSGTQLLTASPDSPTKNVKPAELNTEPDGRFGSFRQTGPPATGNQVNWVADSTCATNDPTRRNFRILATTGGNQDNGNSPFSCNPPPAFTPPGFTPSINCPPPAGQGVAQEDDEFISLIAFIHNQSAFIGDQNAVTQSFSQTVGAIGPNGGLDNQQTNPGEVISIQPGPDVAQPGLTTGLNPRGISLDFVVSNFEAYASLKQTLSNGKFAANPCSLLMIQQMQNPTATAIPNPCFPVGDGNVAGNTVSDVATPNLRQNWRFATNRNAIDGSDNNNITVNPPIDSPFGYFCDDLLGMWIITYFWMTAPPNDPNCGPIYQAIGKQNGFNTDGGPVVMTAFELNVELEAPGCAAEAKEDFTGKDNGAVWLVCPAIPDPRNGGIASDAFLDVVRVNGVAQNTFTQNQFNCLQQTGKFCFESAPGQ